MLSLVISNIFAAHNAGHILSLKFLKSTNTNKNYAVIVTSGAHDVIPGSLNTVGDDYDQAGGNTLVQLPDDQTEMALVWASLDRALHTADISFCWTDGTYAHILPKATGVLSERPQSIITGWFLKKD